jgi:hypothetical protein
MAKYSAWRQWRDFQGSTYRVTVAGDGTVEEAKAHMDQAARDAGWTPARWWQFWRWGE